ncbi:MAG: enoyl-CoA hydratase/isomerase [Candidatus Lindowbacteria bacterium]|nr:enoyl-CoA hydratase/isomerase [Candidatus Lindowbacteria bacterium]
MNYQTLDVRFEHSVCYIQISRPEANNTINDLMVEEFHRVLDLCEAEITVLVIEGSADVFCFGADFEEMNQKKTDPNRGDSDPGPEPLYRLWERLASGPWVSVACVRGKVNAGGVGFVAASDVVLADESAQIGLSEMVFGVLPACVFPFLMRRIGFRAANYMALMTRPISVSQAQQWGLFDAVEPSVSSLLRKHLLSLRRLSKKDVIRYKSYVSRLDDTISKAKPAALDANRDVFNDKQTLAGIFRYLETGQFPWEA